MLRKWVLDQLELVKDSPRVLLRDPLQLLGPADGDIHRFASENHFSVIVASTNLAFRDLYERTVSSSDNQKLLVIDRAPVSRLKGASTGKAPPPFYPDFLAAVPDDARIELDLRRFLRERTGDPTWPHDANEPRFAALMVTHLEAALKAYDNLRAAHPGRFTDHDFKTIVAYAALGVPKTAFKKLKAGEYWTIGLMGHGPLKELSALAPEVTQPIMEELRKAPAPFCWFADHDADLVLRAFYLSVILAQHIAHWKLLIGNIDHDLVQFSGIDEAILRESAPDLVAMDPEQARRDLAAIEESLSREVLELVLLQHLKLGDPASVARVLAAEKYSTLIRSLALLLALDELLSGKLSADHQAQVEAVLFPKDAKTARAFADSRLSECWSNLKDAYDLARRIRGLTDHLGTAAKQLKILKGGQLTFKLFHDLWNEKQVNRLEYYLSSLDRLTASAMLFPRPPAELPAVFDDAMSSIRNRVRGMTTEVRKSLDALNVRFQELIQLQYPSWVATEGEVRLTSQFLKRCLKPNWDPQTEKAVLLIFDGMRYDIWDELLRPMLQDRMDVVKEYPALSLLPSETHLSRKALSAGTYPDSFDVRSSEDKLLKEGLARELSYDVGVEPLSPEGMSTGETVRYRAGNLDVFIFELCDKELHKIPMKQLPDGRFVPGRPLSFVYKQHLKNIIDTEVMAIVRGLPPATKVFVTADHGFGVVAREPLWIDALWVNEPEDCVYLNARLRKSLNAVGAPAKVRTNVLEFPMSALRLRTSEVVQDQKSKQPWQKEYASVVFPRTGYAFSRPKSPFKPDAYSHGGISIQEMMIPMVVLRVREKEEGLIALGEIEGPAEILENEEVAYRLPIRRCGKPGDNEIRVDVEASYRRAPEAAGLPRKVVYVTSGQTEVVYPFRADIDDATDEERRKGVMERTLTISVSYREGMKVIRKSRSHGFTVRLNLEQVIRRVPANLGSILGLMPKGMR